MSHQSLIKNLWLSHQIGVLSHQRLIKERRGISTFWDFIVPESRLCPSRPTPDNSEPNCTTKHNSDLTKHQLYGTRSAPCPSPDVSGARCPLPASSGRPWDARCSIPALPQTSLVARCAFPAVSGLPTTWCFEPSNWCVV